MAQTIQIVPKYSFPYIETVVNDYTLVPDDAVASDVSTDVTQAYAFVSAKGKDNAWVRKSNKPAGIKSYGQSNFKKYGQAYMQALEVLDRENSSVWMMRVMPENAEFSNAVVSAYFKADTAAEVPDAHNRKFRIKMVSKSGTGITTVEELKKFMKEPDGNETTVDGIKAYRDAEGFTQAPFMAVKYTGRGTCGDFYSMRMSQNIPYEKEYGIKMYNFEVIDSENGVSKDANYVGALVSSAKYATDTSTLIDDILGEAEFGLAPVDIYTDEEQVEVVYNAYIKFCKDLNAECKIEYETKLDEYDIPEEMLNGTIPVTDEYRAQYNELKAIEARINATEATELPDIDEFDMIFGRKVGTNEPIDGIEFPVLLTDTVDTTAEDYDEHDYTTTEGLVDFSSVKGLLLLNGGNGYFDNPRTVIIDGVKKQYTYEEEVEICLINAFNGYYDKKILSPRRIAVSVWFDANYPYKVKLALQQLVEARNDGRVFLDVGIINDFSQGTMANLINDYGIFNDKNVSTDIHHYTARETSTNKKCDVTITYFLAPHYADHVNNNGFHIPFVKENCQLTGHMKDSLQPVIEEYDSDIKEKLYDNRLNYFECMAENTFQRAVQNTTQKANTDLLEENNAAILAVLKRTIERDIQSQIYNFADESIRSAFINSEKAVFGDWEGRIVESIELSFQTTEYEFTHSILHLYLAVVFRGLTKKCIVEIDINKRTYSTGEEEEGQATNISDGE